METKDETELRLIADARRHELLLNHKEPETLGPVDVPVLRKALEHITAHPEEWNQEEWIRTDSCGTVCCLAGTVAMQAGYKPFFVSDFGSTAYMVTSPEGEGRFVRSAARELMNLDEENSQLLFSGGNSLSTLWTMASTMTNGEIQVPEDLPVEV
jgi:hypothetical protein